MIIILVMCILIATAFMIHEGSEKTGSSVSHVSPDEDDAYSDAALRELYGKIKCIGEFDTVLGVGWDQVNRDRAVIDRYRTWLETQTDDRVVRAYDKWLRFYEKRVNDVANALETGYAERWRENQSRRSAKYEKEQDVARRINIPRP